MTEKNDGFAHGGSVYRSRSAALRGVNDSRTGFGQSRFLLVFFELSHNQSGSLLDRAKDGNIRFKRWGRVSAWPPTRRESENQGVDRGDEPFQQRSLNPLFAEVELLKFSGFPSPTKYFCEPPS